ncbi:serine/threonine-protein kinase [Crocosphaera sp. XPORK-15E]|uniref:serine/threonine protein kinase n=1 Tax=Crocosphaera sp. XPORK-15E TaxID=3110247 RepID=UPI002B210A78|nr:serine/threonine-protein kinase [Crocosphaera sp. XPORK-15E]MEA5534432.1 serine/threonine-protein kinase [Crocosphaera sp. XPORK-15E]
MLQSQQILCDRYQLTQCLANNAGRQTWLASDIITSPNQSVIVKLLAFHSEMHWDDYKLFEREGDVLKQLNHPKIPRYQDYFTIEKKAGESLCWFGLVQDYIPGKTLQQLLEEGKHFTEENVKNIAIQVLEILQYLHNFEPPILHRDIKPSNLILTEDEQVYLVDFGAVQNAAAVEGVTFTVVGTTGYAPLEQLWGKAVPASDLYGLGATLIHLLTGVSPINLPQDNLRIQFSDRLSIEAFFVKWIERLINPDLNSRFKTAKEALISLNNKRFPKDSLEFIALPLASKIQLQESSHQSILSIPGKLLTVYFNKTNWGQQLLTIGFNFIKLSGLILLAILLLSLIIIILIMFKTPGLIKDYVQPFGNLLLAISQLIKFNLIMHIVLAPGCLLIYFLGDKVSSKIKDLKYKYTYIPQILTVISLLFLRSFWVIFVFVLIYFEFSLVGLAWLKIEFRILSKFIKLYAKSFNNILFQLLHNINSLGFIKIGTFTNYEINIYSDYQLIRLKKSLISLSKTKSYHLSKLTLFYIDKFDNLIIQEKQSKKKESYYLDISYQEKLWLNHYLKNRLETISNSITKTSES